MSLIYFGVPGSLLFRTIGLDRVLVIIVYLPARALFLYLHYLGVFPQAKCESVCRVAQQDVGNADSENV